MSKISLEHATELLTAVGEPFEIVEEDIRGIKTRTWKMAPNSLKDILLATKGFADQTYLVYEDDRMTYSEHYSAVATLGKILVHDFGIKKGDRVAIAMRNYPEWPICFWAASVAGAVVVPLNAWWTAHELEYGLNDSGAKILFADGQRAELLRDHYSNMQLEQVIAVRANATLPSGVERFEDVLKTIDSDDTLPDIHFKPEDDATIFYTSGTTGNPKGALGTQRNICGNLVSLMFASAKSLLRQGKELPNPEEKSEPLAPLISVPFFHATGCHSSLVANTIQGNKIVMMHRWNPERALELIEREKVTSFGGVPSMVWQVLESPDFKVRDTSSLQSIGYGGAPAAPELVTRIQEQFPNVSPSNGYGLTETSSVTTINAAIDYVRKPDSVGTPVPVCEVKLMDVDGQATPKGEVGELWIKGPNVVKGYWNKPEATAKAFTNGWLHSGDLATIDEEGFVYIVDRAKDMLIRGGENVYCVEVENALYNHPAVMDAAVVGIPDHILGEKVGAVVQIVPGTKVSENELQDFVASNLAAFKVPERIEFRFDPLPRNANGKILKAQVKEEFIQYMAAHSELRKER